MRKIITLIICSLLIASLAGCSKSSAIIGQWEDKNDIIEFKTDGHFLSDYYWKDGTYQIQDDKVIMTSKNLGTQEYTYKVKNNQLTITNDSEQITLTKKTK